MDHSHRTYTQWGGVGVEKGIFAYNSEKKQVHVCDRGVGMLKTCALRSTGMTPTHSIYSILKYKF